MWNFIAVNRGCGPLNLTLQVVWNWTLPPYLHLLPHSKYFWDLFLTFVVTFIICPFSPFWPERPQVRFHMGWSMEGHSWGHTSIWFHERLNHVSRGIVCSFLKRRHWTPLKWSDRSAETYPGHSLPVIWCLSCGLLVTVSGCEKDWLQLEAWGLGQVAFQRANVWSWLWCLGRTNKKRSRHSSDC